MVRVRKSAFLDVRLRPRSSPRASLEWPHTVKATGSFKNHLVVGILCQLHLVPRVLYI